MLKIEAAIQSSLIHWIHARYPEVMVTATQNENSYREREQIGSIGITDLILFKRINELSGEKTLHTLFLELKKTKGKLQPSQIDWNKVYDLQFISSNSRRAVAYGYIHAKEIISEWSDGVTSKPQL